MAAAASSQLLLRILPANATSRFSNRLLVGPTKPTSLLLPRVTRPRPVVAFARRRKGSGSSSSTTAPSSQQNKKLQQSDDEVEDNLDEDAFEALFNQLEEDLKNDGMSFDDSDDELSEEDLARLEKELEDAFGDGSDEEQSEALQSYVDDGDDDDELSEEDLARLEKELEDAFGDGSDEEQSEALQSYVDDGDDDDVAEDNDDDEDEEEPPLRLKTWQLRRLASALKIGRRKTSIKSLAGELGLDRALVLELLRDPPPNLLMMCASLPDKVITTPVEPTSLQPEKPESKPTEYSPVAADVKEQKPAVKAPVHAMYKKWSSQKRIKKIQLDTLERVYSRSKRPTNAMISSIVHVTNLPWKRVVKWFEDKRLEDGVPDKHQPYSRPAPETLL